MSVPIILPGYKRPGSSVWIHTSTLLCRGLDKVPHKQRKMGWEYILKKWTNFNTRHDGPLGELGSPFGPLLGALENRAFNHYYSAGVAWPWKEG
jgi:hypothetical protein